MNKQNTMPDVVYHYTSMDTLQKIAETNVIRATSIRYLNDVSERLFFMSETYNRLMSDTGRDIGLRDALLSAIHDPLRKSFVDFPFVASFSRDHDSLPQWRAYCPQGNGVAIGIRTESLMDAYVGVPRTHEKWTATPLVQFSRVDYLAPGDNEAFDVLLSRTIEHANEWHSDSGPEGDASETHPPFNDILRMTIEEQATLVKHRSFEAESEYRLVVTYVPLLGGRIHYRSSRSTLVPYVEVNIPDPTTFSAKGLSPVMMLYGLQESTPYFIDNVVIGPTPHKELSMDALKTFFRGLGHTVHVHSSTSPYRDTI